MSDDNFERIREYFYKLMPENLCQSSVDFFNSVENKEAMIQHLKMYHLWSVNKELINPDSVRVMGYAFLNERGIFYLQEQEEIWIDGGSGFIFDTNANNVEIKGENDFVYFRNCNIRQVDIVGKTKHLIFLPGCRIETVHLHRPAQVATLRLYQTQAARLVVSEGARVDRLLYGYGGSIGSITGEDCIGKVVGA